jgi:hypothetical protein
MQQRDHHDVFLSYAREDRQVADELTWALRARGVRVWRDSGALTVGDSLRRSIDAGLTTSRYGVVVLSPDFLAKAWPQRELDGLITRELAEGRKILLPIWHKVDAEGIRAYSPPLADRVALDTSAGLDVIADEVAVLCGLQRWADVDDEAMYVYRRTETSVDVSHGGTRWVSSRSTTIKATVDGLSGFATSFRIDDLVPGTLEEKVHEVDVALDVRNTDHPRAIERFFRFHTPLRAGEEATITYVRRFSKRSPQRGDMLVKKGNIRSEEAVLRVSFDVAPARLVYKVADRSEVATFFEKTVEQPRSLTTVQRISNPDVALSYGLYWTY